MSVLRSFTRRTLWSQRNARRDQALVIALAIGFVLVMAVVLVLVSHAWTAGSVSASSR